MGHRDSEGYELSAGGREVCRSDDDRVIAAFEDALQELIERRMLRIDGDDIYQITREGYKAAEELRRG